MAAKTLHAGNPARCLNTLIPAYYTENLAHLQVKSSYIHNRNTRTLDHTNNWKIIRSLKHWKTCIKTSETFYMDYWNAFTHTSKMFSYTQLKNVLSLTYHSIPILYWKPYTHTSEKLIIAFVAYTQTWTHSCMQVSSFIKKNNIREYANYSHLDCVAPPPPVNWIEHFLFSTTFRFNWNAFRFHWNVFTHTSNIFSYTQLKNVISHTCMKPFTYLLKSSHTYEWNTFTYMSEVFSIVSE